MKGQSRGVPKPWTLTSLDSAATPQPKTQQLNYHDARRGGVRVYSVAVRWYRVTVPGAALRLLPGGVAGKRRWGALRVRGALSARDFNKLCSYIILWWGLVGPPPPCLGELPGSGGGEPCVFAERCQRECGGQHILLHVQGAVLALVVRQ